MITRWLLPFVCSASFFLHGAQALSILFVVDYFPKLSETFVLNQVTGLLDAGHSVSIYALEKEKKLVHKAYYTYDLAYNVIYQNDSERAKKAFFAEHRFDVILCHFGNMGLIGCNLKEEYQLDAPVFTFFHGYDMSKQFEQNCKQYNLLFKKQCMALPISYCWAHRLVDHGFDGNKIRVHHMGVDCKKFSYTPRTRKAGEPVRFITVARLVEKKGIEFSVRAFAAMLKQYPQCEYIIIGSGPLEDDIKVLIEQLGIQDHVCMLGNCTQEKVIEHVTSAHIFLAPSITAKDGDQEGIPVSLMEAMAMGLPVIGTYHSGIPELVKDGVSGFLVPEKDVALLHEKMNYLIEHQDLWVTMGRAGRRIIEERFNIVKQNERLVALFEECLYGKSYVAKKKEQQKLMGKQLVASCAPQGNSAFKNQFAKAFLKK